MVKNLSSSSINNSQKYFYRNLQNYYGIGQKQSVRISKFFGLSLNGSSGNLLLNDIMFIEQFLRKNFILEFKLKSKILDSINFFIKIKNFKGFRHKNRLPVNGQRSKQNARTVMRLPRIHLNFDESKDIYKLSL